MKVTGVGKEYREMTNGNVDSDDPITRDLPQQVIDSVSDIGDVVEPMLHDKVYAVLEDKWYVYTIEEDWARCTAESHHHVTEERI